MSKFAKRIRKIKKFPQYAISIGDEYENFSDILGVFQTVFVVGVKNKNFKEKNLIYLEDIGTISLPNGVDMIFSREDNKNQLLGLQHIIRQNRPLIFLHTEIEISKEHSDFFRKIQYHATEILSDYQIWKMNG
jgi:hypothetical protein